MTPFLFITGVWAIGIIILVTVDLLFFPDQPDEGLVVFGLQASGVIYTLGHLFFI